MKSIHSRLLFWIAGLLAATATAFPAETNRPIDFKELYDLLRAHLSGVDEAALNEAATQGLIDQLKPRVVLLTDKASAPDTNGPALASARVFDRAYAYLRVDRVADGLDKELWTAYRDLASSNRLQGVVVDLRFADGRDYAAAAATADRFLSIEKPLLDWGEGLRRSAVKTDAVAGPVVVLVNRETAGAAEALASVLRQDDVALLIGGVTAGTASATKDFTLKTGQQVRVAVAPVTVAGGKAIPLTGLKPDINVEVSPENERLWYEDPYAEMPRPSLFASAETGAANEASLTGTNRPSRRRINEADLIRMLRDGQMPDADPASASPRQTAPARPVLRDPALARALDLLKGLAAVRKFRPS